MQPTQTKTIPLGQESKQPVSKPQPLKTPVPLDAEQLQQVAGGKSPGKGW